jgi:hypothetical protein
MWKAPPGRASISRTVLINPFGPQNCARCLGSVNILKTSPRGASNMRVTTRTGLRTDWRKLLRSWDSSFRVISREDVSIVCQALIRPPPHGVRGPAVRDPPDRVDRAMCLGSHHGYRLNYIRSARKRPRRAALRRHDPLRCPNCTCSSGNLAAASLTSAGKSENSCTWRISITSLSEAGQRDAHSTASSIDFT